MIHEKQFEIQNLEKIWPRLCKKNIPETIWQDFYDIQKESSKKTTLIYTWGEAFFSAHKR